MKSGEKLKVDKCEYFQNDTGCCFGQKNAPKCYCDDTDECEIINPKKEINKSNKTKGISVKVNAQLNWEKICRHIIFTYNLDEQEIGQHITDHAMDFVNVSINS